MRLSKGTLTKENILKEAFKVASLFGLESLSIGELAKLVGMSKSGLFGHFNSKEKLQIMVLDFAANDWVNQVVRPALKTKRGIDRIKSIMENWIKWSSNTLPGGCPFISAAIEYDDRPGAVRDHIVHLQQQMLETFKKACKIAIEEKQFKDDLNVNQFAFELYSFMIGQHVYRRLLEKQNAKILFENALDDLIKRSQN